MSGGVGIHACIHVCVCVCVCVCAYIWACPYICVHILICACSCVHACVHTCVRMCIHVCTYVVWCTFDTVISTLEEIERDVTLNGSKLPESLQKLRLTLSHWHICNVADNQGLTHSSQLPMVTPPAGIPPHSVYIKHSLIDGVYIVS